MFKSIPPDKRDALNDLGFLLFWALCFCVVGIGRGSLASWDEAYYAIVSKGIAASGDWIHLRFFNGPFYDKPPLYLWETALFYKLWGISEFTTRLGSSLAGIGTILVTYLIGRHLFGRLTGFASAGVLLSSTDFLHYARWGTLDVTHLFFFSLALYAFIKTGRGSSLWWLVFWVASAGAVMTKGLVIVLAWLIVFIQALNDRDLSFFRRKSFWAGIALFLALALPWYVAAYLSDPRTFMHDIVYKHYVARTSGAVEGHAGTWYFYIRTLINKYHPWILLALLSVPWAIWNCFESEKRSENRFILLWLAVVLGVFTFLVKTKLQWYILPLHPALSITVGILLAQWFKKREIWLRGLIALVLLLHLPFSSVLVQDYAAGIKALAPVVKKKVDLKNQLYLYEYHDQPAALFYFERSTAYVDSPEQLATLARPGVSVWIVMRKNQYTSMKNSFDVHHFRVVQDTRGLKEDLVFLSNA